MKKLHIESELALTLTVFTAMLGMAFLPLNSGLRYNELSADLLDAQVDKQVTFDESAPFTQSLPQGPQTIARCDYETPKKTVFSGRFLAMSRRNFVAPGEVFMMQAHVQNNGNVPWFSSESGCSQESCQKKAGAMRHAGDSIASREDKSAPWCAQPGTKARPRLRGLP